MSPLIHTHDRGATPLMTRRPASLPSIPFLQDDGKAGGTGGNKRVLKNDIATWDKVEGTRPARPSTTNRTIRERTRDKMSMEGGDTRYPRR